MNNIHATLRQFVAPFAPPPISDEKLQEARAEAWEQVQRSEAADPRMLRALRQQQEFLQSQGVLWCSRPSKTSNSGQALALWLWFLAAATCLTAPATLKPRRPPRPA